MKIIMDIAFGFLDIVYFFMKLAPRKDKVVFISRQSDVPGPNFTLVAAALAADHPGIQVVMMCRMIRPGLKAKLGYIGEMFAQMRQMADARVVVLDTYCITVSCLHHRKGLKVIQMWHALGCFKKFGCSILDRPGGSSSKLAQAMRMHRNYDYVFVSAPVCKPFFAQAFATDIARMVVQPLPIVDQLTDPGYIRATREKVLTAHPQLKDKPVVLYAPTFRKDEAGLAQAVTALCRRFDYRRYNLVIKPHPLSKITFDESQVITDPAFSTQQFACAADLVITDYSAVVYEIALLGKPMVFYAFDKADYADARDFYIDYDKQMPGPICQNLDGLLKVLAGLWPDGSAVRAFADTYVAPGRTHNAADIAAFIAALMR